MEIDVGAVAGKPAESPIYQSVLRTGDLVMPPKERNALSEEQVAIIKRWVEIGLPWAEGEADPAWSADEGITITTSGGLDDGWTKRRYKPEDIWAFLPVKEVEVPNNGAVHPIDAFLKRKLDAKELTTASGWRSTGWT